MKVQIGNPTDIQSWMDLVKEVKWNFPGLETEEALEKHKRIVLNLCLKIEPCVSKSKIRLWGFFFFRVRA